MARLLPRTPSRRLMVLFLVVLLPPAVTLIWLGLRLLDQDRALNAQRAIERREAAADAIVRSLTQSLAGSDAWLSGASLPDGAVRIQIRGHVVIEPPGRVLWLPSAPALAEADASLFAEAQRLELSGIGDRGVAQYDALTESSDPAVRAAAAMSLARVYRQTGRTAKALNLYRQLAATRNVGFGSVPVDFVARRAACTVLESLDRLEELRRDAAGIEADLLAGRWNLDAAVWSLAQSEVERWLGRPVLATAEARALSVAADAIWAAWRSETTALTGTRRDVFISGNLPITVLRRGNAAELNAVAIPPSVVTGWMSRAVDAVPGATATLMSAEGARVAGAEMSGHVEGLVRRPRDETALPWTVLVRSAAPPAVAAELAGRRRLLLTGLTAITLLLIGGSYLLWRLVTRELALARVQTEFVAAVSHEFRTPLTSIRHVTELLSAEGVLPEARRARLYGALDRSGRRLHSLVESLLDFARMESGRRTWRKQPTDLARVISTVVEQFRHEAIAEGHSIAAEITAGIPFVVQADPDAIGHALWNLLDNACKYGPADGAVRITVRPHSRGCAVAVTDEGPGVPRDEQRVIFDRFVRGRRATELGIKGTGLGLAIVSHIVQAHRGRVEVESQDGAGSTFTIVLPLAPDANIVASEAAAPAHGNRAGMHG